MKFEIFVLIVIGWIFLYCILFFLGSYLIDKCSKTFTKRWGESEKIIYAEHKKTFRWNLTIYFVAILILFIIGIWEKIY